MSVLSQKPRLPLSATLKVGGFVLAVTLGLSGCTVYEQPGYYAAPAPAYVYAPPPPPPVVVYGGWGHHPGWGGGWHHGWR